MLLCSRLSRRPWVLFDFPLPISFLFLLLLLIWTFFCYFFVLSFVLLFLYILCVYPAAKLPHIARSIFALSLSLSLSSLIYIYTQQSRLKRLAKVTIVTWLVSLLIRGARDCVRCASSSFRCRHRRTKRNEKKKKKKKKTTCSALLLLLLLRCSSALLPNAQQTANLLACVPLPIAGSRINANAYMYS